MSPTWSGNQAVPSCECTADVSICLQVSLSFYEKRKKQSGWAIIGGAQEERLYWEQWYAPWPSMHARPYLQQHFTGCGRTSCFGRDSVNTAPAALRIMWQWFSTPYRTSGLHMEASAAVPERECYGPFG